MRRHAVVIGASMAGLLAARVLAGSFEQVTLLERDTLPPPGEGRRGVAQGQHVHGLMARGREILDEFFPGLTGDLATRGAPLGDARVQGRWFLHGGYWHRQSLAARQESLLVSRPLLEGIVRARVLALPGVRAIEACAAVGLVAGDGGRVTGVRVRRGQPGNDETTVAADLVVDASGRGSRATAWLAALGYAAPEEEQVRVGLTYTSRLFRRNRDDLDGDLFAMDFPEPPSHRAGLIAAQEDDRWHVTLIGYLGEHAPTSETGFLDYARSLRIPDIHDVIKQAEPLSDPVIYRFPASRRRRYETLGRIPDGFLAIGDALCSFNPVYAQGMSVAALEALALQDCLAAGPAHLERRFYQRASAIIESAWRVSAGGDLRFPEVEGERSPVVRIVNWYLGRLHVAAHRDPEVAASFQKVVNMLAPPASVLQVPVAWRVLRGNLSLMRAAGRDRSASLPRGSGFPSHPSA